MKTHFQVQFPLEPGSAFPIQNGNGIDMPIRARSDTRPTGIPTRILTRDEWDSLRGKGGPYIRPVGMRKAVPDVDFQAEDGTLYKTAEECLKHELKARFGVETLDEVVLQLYLAKNQPHRTQPEPFTPVSNAGFVTGVIEVTAAVPQEKPKRKYTRRPKPLTDDEKIRLLTSALSQKGLKHCEAAKATGLKSKECKRLAKANPTMFRDKAGKLFNVDAV